MTPATFLRRLGIGKGCNCIYQQGDLEGLISVWWHKGEFILTWEECHKGDQYNENAYTRDDRRSFASAEELLAFVEHQGFPASAFSP